MKRARTITAEQSRLLDKWELEFLLEDGAKLKEHVSMKTTNKRTNLVDTTIDSAPMLSIAEVAQRLNVSDQTVRNMIDRGALQAYRIGDLYRFRPGDVERFILDSATATTSRVEPPLSARAGR